MVPTTLRRHPRSVSHHTVCFSASAVDSVKQQTFLSRGQLLQDPDLLDHRADVRFGVGAALADPHQFRNLPRPYWRGHQEGLRFLCKPLSVGKELSKFAKVIVFENLDALTVVLDIPRFLHDQVT